VALSADIVKIFHQVKVRQPDGPALRFFYHDLGSLEPPEVYQMDVQPFSAICSPTICAHVRRKAAEDGGADADNVTQQVIVHFYVDNWLTSFPSSEEAIRYAEKVTKVLNGDHQVHKSCFRYLDIPCLQSIWLYKKCQLNLRWDYHLITTVIRLWSCKCQYRLFNKTRDTTRNV
jgi:hypothetical protein